MLKRLRLESSHCENTIHEEGRGGGGGGGEGGEEMQQTRPRLESSHVNTECVRKEEEEEEEEKEEERKEEGRSWRCARKTRTPHKGCGEKSMNIWVFLWFSSGFLCCAVLSYPFNAVLCCASIYFVGPDGHLQTKFRIC